MPLKDSKITLFMNNSFEELNSTLPLLYDRLDFENQLDAIDKSCTTSDYYSKLAELYNMFDVCGIEYKKDEKLSYYRRLVQRSNLPEPYDVTAKVIELVSEKILNCCLPEDYMLRIVNRLSKAEDIKEGDSLRLRILKQFIKYGDYLYYAVIPKQNGGKPSPVGGRTYIKGYAKKKLGKKRGITTEEVVSVLDDDVFLPLESAAKEQKKPVGCYGLLKIADDLACGKFRMGGATKRNLYYFAMVFDMTFRVDDSNNEGYDIKRDIEKNLFHDYYENGILRVLSQDYLQNPNGFEAMPSGVGINYKNFAEMIYLYYIAKNIPPQQKIKRSGEMIARVLKRAGVSGRSEDDGEGNETRYYRELAGKGYFDYDEDEFEQFVLNNFCCKIAESDGYKTALEYKKEQNSAYNAYLDIIGNIGMFNENTFFFDDSDDERSPQQIQEKRRLILEKKSLELPFDGECLQEFALDREEYEFLVRKKNKSRNERFMILLYNLNRLMVYDPQNNSREKGFFITSADKITRSDIIIACYYFFILRCKNNENKKWSFREIFDFYCTQLNDYFEQTYYGKFSTANVFDLLIVFLSYCSMLDERTQKEYKREHTDREM